MRTTSRVAGLLILCGAWLAACGSVTSVATVGPIPTTSQASPGASPVPGGACTAAPTPPANLPGWSSAQQAPSVFPAIVNSARSLTCGDNRILLTFFDTNNRPIATPDRSVTMTFYDLGRDPATPVEKVDGRFVWGIENERGFFVASATFSEAGIWGAEIVTAVGTAAPETIRMTFEVATSSPVVRVGQKAPASDTPTAATVGGDLARLSTDPSPDPALYRTSIKDAVDAHKPFVVIFATPKFCTSAQCGPTLDRVKPLAADFPTVAFIHVEPYLLTFQNGTLQPVLDAQSNLQIVQAVADYGLLSEPWVFVVDRTGTVTASFEGVVATDEIRAAADAVK